MFTFDKPIIADTLRVQFTKKSPNSEGYYSVLLGEVEYTAYKVTPEEAEKASAEYRALLGQSESTENADDFGVLVLFVCISVVILAAGAVLFFIPLGKKGKKEGRA